jgi:methanogenic corrinoid protein MtbC1
MAGLSPDVVRIWERRYGVVRPARGRGGARLYNADDIACLRLLGKLVREGRRIGDVAHLGRRTLERLAAEPGPDHIAAGAASPALVTAVLDAVARFDGAAVARQLGDVVAAIGGTEFVRQLAGPLLETAGERWSCGELSVAEEHFLTEIMRSVLIGFCLTRVPRRGRTILLVTPPGERHELGLLLVAVLAADAGLTVIHLGADLPAEEIANAARRTAAAVVALGCVDANNVARATTAVRYLVTALPGGTELWLGGRAARAVADRARRSRVLVLETLARAEDELRRVASVDPKTNA